LHGSDDFSGAVLNWDSLGNPQFGGPSGTDYHLDGGKLVHGVTGDSYHPAVPANVGAFSNFEFEVDADSPNSFWGIAWGLQDNAHYYFAQSYSGTLRVYRVNSWSGGADFTQLGNGFAAPSPSETPQHIRLVGQNGTCTIYVDGSLIGTVQDATYPTGKVGVVGYGSFVTNFDNAFLRGFGTTINPGGAGVYTSDAHDFGDVHVWNGLSWIGQTPTGTSVQFSTRSSPDNVAWSDWANVDGSGNIASPANRFLQYRAQLASTDLNSSPVVEEVVVNSSVQATTHSLTVTTNGNGTVSSIPVGIDCGMTCSHDFNQNTFVTLTATSSFGSSFTGWNGACTGTGSCVVTMDGDKTITATFIQTPTGVVLGQPSGTLTIWDHTFNWTGFTDATWYNLEVQTASGAPVLNYWYTSAEAGCAGGTTCAVTPPPTLNLANGDYQWRIQDYGPSGYGSWTAFQNFTLNQ
jgi:hypothetical protein